MKKSIFTLAMVAVAFYGSANACNPSNPFRHLWHKTVALEAAEKTLATAHPGKTVAIEAAEKTQPIIPDAKGCGPMLKNVAHLDNVAFGSHGWL